MKRFEDQKESNLPIRELTNHDFGPVSADPAEPPFPVARGSGL